jgi:F-type H+-transporting ATPase subunit a
LPSGAPLQLFFLLIIIETISYLIRFFSLAIRIFANMVSGGILMKILVGFSVYLFGLLSFASFGGVVLWVISFLILFLEFFVAGLQAYVFIFLSVVYLNEILHIGSH